jgi:hypothetical protein
VRDRGSPDDERDGELFAAAVCQVPLLDMQRYHKLLAGARAQPSAPV